MPEMRVSHLLILVVILAVIATPFLVCFGFLVIPSVDLFGWKTPELNKKTMEEGIDKGLATAAGYTPAKSPQEAMDQFRKAIQERKYKFAAIYVTKPYGEQLERAHDSAKELGEKIDRIRNFGDNKKILSDKVKLALYRIDPFPTNFKSGAAPKQEGDKATGKYVWELQKLENPGANIFEDVQSMDAQMFKNVLRGTFFLGQLNLVKVGDDWKIDVPMNPVWEADISHFVEHSKTHVTGLDGFVNDMTREQFDSKAKFESELFAKFRNAK